MGFRNKRQDVSIWSFPNPLDGAVHSVKSLKLYIRLLCTRCVSSYGGPQTCSLSIFSKTDTVAAAASIPA